MKRITIVSLAVLVVSGLAMGQTVNMANSAHDLSDSSTGTTLNATNVDRICVFCHTPHQADGAGGAGGQDPLWNHSFPASVPTYGVYGSDTLDHAPSEVGAAAGAASISMLCMSCHDGSVGVGSLYNDPNTASGGVETVPNNSAAKITSNANLGTDLTDEHPVNFIYTTAAITADGELVTPDSSDWVDTDKEVPLFGNSVQCASCHDPHDDTNVPFLVKSNADSLLCVECHVK